MNLLFVHTSKAVKNGCPEDRLFLVTTVFPPERKNGKPEYMAWKCTITQDGIEHPGFKKTLSLAQIISGVGRNEKSKNGAEATAFFKPDSYYKEISYDDLRMLIAQSSRPSRSKKEVALVKNFKKAEEKLTEEERKAVYKMMNNVILRRKHADPSWFPFKTLH